MHLRKTKVQLACAVADGNDIGQSPIEVGRSRRRQATQGCVQESGAGQPRPAVGQRGLLHRDQLRRGSGNGPARTTVAGLPATRDQEGAQHTASQQRSARAKCADL